MRSLGLTWFVLTSSKVMASTGYLAPWAFHAAVSLYFYWFSARTNHVKYKYMLSRVLCEWVLLAFSRVIKEGYCFCCQSPQSVAYASCVKS